jgi:hypothetical protein
MRPSPIQEHQPEVHHAAIRDTKLIPMPTKPKPQKHPKPPEWIQFDQSADLQSVLTDTGDYIQTTKSMLEAGFPRKQHKVMKRKNARRGNPFPSLAIIEETLKMETRQSQNTKRGSKGISPLGLQISFPQNSVLLDEVSSYDAGQKNYFADFENALDDSFWNGKESTTRWNGMGMQLATTADAKETSSLPLKSDENSI